MAFDVINTQVNQRGMLMGWLDRWHLTQSCRSPRSTG